MGVIVQSQGTSFCAHVGTSVDLVVDELKAEWQEATEFWNNGQHVEREAILNESFVRANVATLIGAMLSKGLELRSMVL